MVIIEFECRNRPGVALRIFQALADLNLEDIELISVEREIPFLEKVISFILRTKPFHLSGHGRIVVQDYDRIDADRTLERLAKDQSDMGIVVTGRYFRTFIALPNSPGTLRNSLVQLRSHGVSIHEITTRHVPQGVKIPEGHRGVMITFKCPAEAYFKLKEQIRPYLVEGAE